jgi:hypothetical protein
MRPTWLLFILVMLSPDQYLVITLTVLKAQMFNYIYHLDGFIAEDPEYNLSAMSGKISGNFKKNTKIINFFQYFKHLKQQHQTNTLLHKYENKTDI